MNEKPKYFDKKVYYNDYLFYANEQGRLYIPSTKNEFESFLNAVYSTLENPTEKQKQNYKIMQKYPFLLPKNRWDRGFTLNNSNDLFTYTELDAMPRPWIVDFGWNMVQEIKEAILEYDENFLYQYTITDIKEKYGGLRWYDAGYTPAMEKVISKYERRSYEVELNELSEKLMNQYSEAYKKLAE